jgi:DNA replication and repair protein RecF
MARINLSAEISPVITGYYRRLSGGVDEITCDYRSSILKDLDALDAADFLDTEDLDSVVAEPREEYCAGGPSEEMLRNAFAEKLADLEYVEKLQGVTMAGPHRDDLALCASGYEMRSVGSQGQCRSAAIAMRFAAVDVAAQHVGKPILLLDDIFAWLNLFDVETDT